VLISVPFACKTSQSLGIMWSVVSLVCSVHATASICLVAPSTWKREKRRSLGCYSCIALTFIQVCTSRLCPCVVASDHPRPHTGYGVIQYLVPIPGQASRAVLSTLPRSHPLTSSTSRCCPQDAHQGPYRRLPDPIPFQLSTILRPDLWRAHRDWLGRAEPVCWHNKAAKSRPSSRHPR
jgi:hypothetical protein